MAFFKRANAFKGVAQGEGGFPLTRPYICSKIRTSCDFPVQRQEALAMLKMLAPAEEIQNLMATVQEQIKTIEH